MNPLWVLVGTWGLVTGVLVVLYLCRSHLESRETDWIPLTEDTREEKAIQQQQTIEGRVHKFDMPIHALSALSIVLLLTIIGYWAYTGLSTPPPMP